MAVDPPTVPELGVWTESEIRQVEEFFGGFTNRAGIPDTKSGIRTRANASWPRFMVELWVCVNEVFAGRKTVPGIQDPGVGYSAGRVWRPGDDESNVVAFSDLTFYSIALPAVLWGLDGESTSEAGAQVIAVNSNDANRRLWEAVTHRGGVSDLSAGLEVYGLRNTGNLNYYAAAPVSGMETAGDLTVCGVFNLPQWNQANNGVVLLSHAPWNSDHDATVGKRLGFEIGLGDSASAGDDSNDLALYYRGADSVPVTAEIPALVRATGERLALPWNRDYHVAVQRYDSGGSNWRVRFVINGIEVSDQALPGTPTPGTSPDMRMLFGSRWDGTGHLGGGMRNVMVWPSGTLQPTVGELQQIYRIGAGFQLKAV